MAKVVINPRERVVSYGFSVFIVTWSRVIFRPSAIAIGK